MARRNPALRAAAPLAVSITLAFARAALADPPQAPAPLPTSPTSPLPPAPPAPPSWPPPYGPYGPTYPPPAGWPPPQPPYSPPPAGWPPPTFSRPPEPRAPRGAWAESDPFVAIGGALLGTSALMGVSGIVLVAASRGDGDSRQRGVGLLAGSGAMAVIGLPTLLGGLHGGPPKVGARRSPRAAMFGAWLTGLGAGIGVYGLTAGLSYKVKDEGASIVTGIAGLTTMLVGIPLWIYGALPAPPDSRDPAATAPVRDEAFMKLGIGLASVGLVAIAGALVAMTATARHDEFGGNALTIGGSLGITGIISLGAGVPLWIVYGGPKPLGQAAMMPMIAAGPGGVNLTWRLP